MKKPLIDLLEEIQHLMELKGENPFKVRAFDKAAKVLEEASDDEDWKLRAKEGTLTELPGIGKGISQVLTEFILEGKSSVRDELKESLPEGLLELTRVPGLGPKKAMQLVTELEIKTLGELEYACRENRLLKLKGFGEKVQTKILEGVQFLAANRGQLRLSEAFPIAERILPVLSKAVNDGRHPAGGGLRIVETGELRRRRETLSSLEFLVETLPGMKTTASLEEKLYGSLALDSMSGEKLGLPVKFHFATTSEFPAALARTTATTEHWKALGADAKGIVGAPTEEEFYAKLGVPFIAPEMRETGEEIELARQGKLAQVLPWDGIRGVFHNHTTMSDGAATLEEMVLAAKARGYEYIGISDHSQSAFYAQGLKEDALDAQEKEVRRVQEKYPEVRIFWGIESDILADGSLDYDDRRLKRFDFVIASVHSRFQMDQEAMTDRILQAIRHPATRFVGHLTGRLLLGRKGYDLHVEKIIEEAAKRNVAIEINAHPARLDIDWRWGSELRRRSCMVSVNPDAHEIAGLDDTKYGILVARKALLPSSLVLNSMGTKEVEAWLKR